jgi:DivIVA domain-containing protein
MIELTPLDVRKKRGDFGKALRGYDPKEVDVFLELVAERMEELVKENLALREDRDGLAEKVAVQEGREKAIQDALVTAQELRQDVKEQARREANVLEREARTRIELMIAESGRVLTDHRGALEELERQRDRFLKAFRTFLERELDTVEVEMGRAPLENVTLDLELGKVVWSMDGDEDKESDDDSKARVAVDDAEEVDLEVGNDSEIDFAAEDENGATERTAAGVLPAPESGDAEAEDGQQEPELEGKKDPEASEEGESLWLSSIMGEREDEDAD